MKVAIGYRLSAIGPRVSVPARGFDIVTPAKAGVQGSRAEAEKCTLDSRVRGNDGVEIVAVDR
jgi:hypothetical protein